jgi:hypothetical protein
MYARRRDYIRTRVVIKSSEISTGWIARCALLFSIILHSHLLFQSVLARRRQSEGAIRSLCQKNIKILKHRAPKVTLNIFPFNIFILAHFVKEKHWKERRQRSDPLLTLLRSLKKQEEMKKILKKHSSKC